MNILIAEKNEGLRLRLAAGLVNEGFSVVQVADEGAALAALSQAAIALFILDLEIPTDDRLGLVSSTRATLPNIPIVLMVNGSPEEKVRRALGLGARECLRKPIDPSHLAACARRILLEPSEKPPITVPQAIEPCDSPPDAVWSPATRELYERLGRAALSDATLLISGETGTGKEVAARTVHALSNRRMGSMLSVNCAALSAGLLESELFGHEKGAFTGADRMRKGRFELADRGTLLLDEIGELHPDYQSKLLRVLQERAFERVGSSDTIKADVRVIATTNRDLRAEVARGRFREDLFYRLNVLHVHMPPLRERSSEVILLLEHFLKKGGRPRSRFSSAALDALRRNPWRGNVRELENLVAFLLTQTDTVRVELEHLPEEFQGSTKEMHAPAPRTPLTLKCVLQEAERRHIREILEEVSWNRRRAAEILEIGRNRLIRKMREYDLHPPGQIPVGC